MTTLLAALCLAPPPAPLVPGPTFKMPKTGGFDYMAVDPVTNRVFASHPRAGSLAVLDLGTEHAWEIETGGVNGVQIDAALGKVFAGGGEQGQLVELDRKSLKIERKVSFDGPGDDIAIDSKRQQIYVCHDDGTEDWVVDAKTMKKLGKVDIAGAPEYVEYDRKTDRLYQNIKPTNQLQVIDPVARKVAVSWDTGEEKGPHGLALDLNTGVAFSAGSNGKMTVFKIATGKPIATVDIVPRTDQIAFDPVLRRVYCAGAGAITVIQETATGAKSLGDVKSPRGAHTIAVDPRDHSVWICYPSDSGAYFQKYTAR